MVVNVFAFFYFFHIQILLIPGGKILNWEIDNLVVMIDSCLSTKKLKIYENRRNFHLAASVKHFDIYGKNLFQSPNRYCSIRTIILTAFQRIFFSASFIISRFKIYFLLLKPLLNIVPFYKHFRFSGIEKDGNFRDLRKQGQTDEIGAVSGRGN